MQTIFLQIESEELKTKNFPSIIMANINLRRFSEARSLIKELETKDNNISKLLLAKCYSKEGDLQSALNILVENCEENPQWWNELGVLYWNTGEFKKSFNCFLKVLFLNNVISFCVNSI